MIPPELMPLVWFGAIATTGYLFFRKFSDVIKEKMRRSHLSIQHKSKGEADISNQIDEFLDKSPSVLSKVNQQIEEQRAKGVKDEQMKGLLNYKGILELAANNRELAEMLGKPVLVKAYNMFKGWSI